MISRRSFLGTPLDWHTGLTPRHAGRRVLVAGCNHSYKDVRRVPQSEWRLDLTCHNTEISELFGPTACVRAEDVEPIGCHGKRWRLPIGKGIAARWIEESVSPLP